MTIFNKKLILIFAIIALIFSSKLYAQDEEANSSNLWKQCNPNTGFGVLDLRGQSAFQLIRLSLFPDDPSTIPPGYYEFKQTTTWTNRWGYKKDKYLLDAEIIRVSTRFSYGLSNSIQLGVEIPACYRSGGVLDGLIMNFHNNLNIGQSHRDDFDKDQLLIKFNKKDGSTYTIDSNDIKVGLEDLIFSLKYKFDCGDSSKPAVALTTKIKIPTGKARNLFGSEGIDVNESLSISKGFGDWFLYGALGYTYFNDNEIAGIEMEKTQYTIFLGAEYMFRDNFSFIGQALINSGPAKDYYEFSELTYEVVMGCKWEISSGSVLEFGLIENLLHYDNSPDFGIHFGYAVRFN